MNYIIKLKRNVPISILLSKSLLTGFGIFISLLFFIELLISVFNSLDFIFLFYKLEKLKIKHP